MVIYGLNYCSYSFYDYYYSYYDYYSYYFYYYYSYYPRKAQSDTATTAVYFYEVLLMMERAMDTTSTC